MATIKDVAREAGVSVSTVSRVLTGNAKVAENKKTAVVEAMQALGYRPNTFARALVNRRANSIGLVVGELADPFFGVLMENVESVLSAADQQIIISCGHQEAEKERQAIEFLIQRNCDAIIVHAKALSDQALVELSHRGPPFIMVNRFVPELAGSCVYLDNQRGGYLATEHLIQSGHRQIACIISALPIEDSEQRLAGYRQALEQHGIEYDPDLVVQSLPSLFAGCRGTEALLANGKPFTAVFAYNDVLAAACITTLEDRGLSVPDDVSVIGFDDIYFAHFVKPRLTTVRYPIAEMGRLAAELALHKVGLARETAELENQFQPTLVIRESVTAG